MHLRNLCIFQDYTRKLCSARAKRHFPDYQCCANKELIFSFTENSFILKHLCIPWTRTERVPGQAERRRGVPWPLHRADLTPLSPLFGGVSSSTPSLLSPPLLSSGPLPSFSPHPSSLSLPPGREKSVFGSRWETGRERERVLWEESQSVFLRERAEWRELCNHPQEAVLLWTSTHVPDHLADWEEEKVKSENRKKEVSDNDDIWSGC